MSGSQVNKMLGDLVELIDYLAPEDRLELEDIVRASTPIWVPLPGPQTMALESEADVVFYGGAAGGGKTDLAVGLALTQHLRSIIYRRVGTELIGIIDRMTEILGNKDGFNGQDDIWRLQGRQIEFGSCRSLGDEKKYQGRAHDFKCVGKGTLILMGDGTARLVENIRVDDEVATLEGPRRVTRLFPSYVGSAVTINVDGAEQIQGFDHHILTDNGWVNHDKYVSASQHVARATLHRSAYISGLSKHSLIQVVRQFPEQFSLDQQHKPEPAEQDHHLSSQGFCASVAQVNQGSGSVVSSYQRAGVLRRLSRTVRQGLQSLVRGLSLRDYAHRPAFHDAGYAQEQTLSPDCQGDCSSGFHQYDAPTHLCEGYDQVFARQLNGVEVQNPSGSVGGGLEQTRKCSCSGKEYVHPYTKEKRQILVETLDLPLVFTSCEDTELFDFTVDGVNHYISYNGFVNRNCFDEVTNFLESQVRFLMGWQRSAVKGQRCRILFTGNPPTDAEGEWVISFFAPWLDTQYKGTRAKSGEIRWFAMLDGKDVEVPNGDPFIHTYEDGKTEKIQPQSRTFILSKVQDNAFLMATGYEATLQALPEPLRSQMLNADFTAGKDANPYQVIPTAWVEAAQARWTEEGKKGPMSSVGVDVARGGKCFTVISRRHGGWYDKLLRYPGVMTPDGPSVAAFAIGAAQHGAPIHVDSIGVGTSPVDHLKGAGVHVVPINGAETGKSFTDTSGRLTFYNMRAKLWWGLREKLDPKSSDPIAIPPGQEIKADLCAPLWMLRNGKILIESKEALIERIGRSPDDGDAIVYCSVDTMKRDVQIGKVRHEVEYDPFTVIDQAAVTAGHAVDYDPYTR